MTSAKGQPEEQLMQCQHKLTFTPDLSMTSFAKRFVCRGNETAISFDSAMIPLLISDFKICSLKLKDYKWGKRLIHFITSRSRAFLCSDKLAGISIGIRISQHNMATTTMLHIKSQTFFERIFQIATTYRIYTENRLQTGMR